MKSKQKIQFRRKKNYRNDKNQSYEYKNDKNRNRYENQYSNRYSNRNNQYSERKYQKTYAVDKQSYYNFEPFESYEKINSNKKFDDEKSLNLYSYNLQSKSSNVCKKCDAARKKFNNFFHNHILICFKKSILFFSKKKISNL